jgi:hypothetical protein
MRKTFAALVGAICLIAQAAAQPASPPERDPIRFAIGSDEIVIDDRALVPRQIARVATQAGCSFQSALESKESVRIIRAKPTPNNTVMFALVPCVAGPYVATLVLHLANQVREPVVVQLPVMAERGFIASTYAGYVSWDAAKLTLTARRGSDMCPSPAVRYRYTISAGREFSLAPGFFDLARIEWQDDRCGGGDWRVLWEAQAWNLSIP